jgi:PD-(D/E)XK endonuclease
MSQRRQNNNHNLRNTKRTGERSEAAFLYQATQRSFGICKPWGDSERYDFILDNRPKPEVHLFRVQVKCTDSLRAGAYETRATCTTGKGRAVYTKRDIDFVAAHVVELNIWYIIPVEVCTPQPMLRFYPHRKAKKMRLEQYREAWHLLDPPVTPLTIHACADEDYPEGRTSPLINLPSSRACYYESVRIYCSYAVYSHNCTYNAI